MRWIDLVGMLILVACSGLEPLVAQQAERARLHGYVREAGSGEPIVLASVELSGGGATLTDRDGYFSISVPSGGVALRVRAYGYAPLDTLVASGSRVDLAIRPAPIGLAPVRVEARRAPEVSIDPQVRIVSQEQLRDIPPGLEADLFRSLQALPGVAAATPVSSRLLVRGGGPDQNQFLLDGFPVLYPYHLAGAFSAFHMGAVQDVAFWSGAPPPRYGGHLSSVIDIELREGNSERLEGEASVGMVTSSGVLEGPIPGGAGMVAARRTYVDALARVPGRSFPYYFWDTTAKLRSDLTSSDRLTLIAFYGRDRLYSELDEPAPGNEPPDDEFAWRNGVIGLSWRHLFGGRAVLEQRVSRSFFRQHLSAGTTAFTGALAESEHDVDLWMARGELSLLLGSDHTLEVGYEAGQREDGHRTGYSNEFAMIGRRTWERSGQSSGNQLAGYVEERISVGPARLRVGLRGEWFESNRSLQPRASLAVAVREKATLHGWWGRVRQYEHVLQDPDLDLTSLYSVDIWLPADEAEIAPGTAQHFGLGAELGLPHDVVLRVDAYAKTMTDLFAIPEATEEDRRVAIERLEPVDGRAAGVDVLLRRMIGEDLTGWLGYSYLDARHRTTTEEFPMWRQPRQRLTSVLGWMNGRWTLNARFEGVEGLPYTPAVGSIAHRPFDFGYGDFSPLCPAVNIEYIYGRRNSARTPWSKRLDLSGRYTRETRAGWSWEVGIALYNALFDPPGIFRPSRPSFYPPEACEYPVPVEREPEVRLPPLPSLTVRIRF